MDPVSVLGAVTNVFAATGGVLSRFQLWAEGGAQTSRRIPLEPQLYEAESADKPQIDLCFVHGLSGDERTTWTATGFDEGKGFWPKHLVSSEQPDFPRARILLYKYNTDVCSFCWLINRTLYHHSRHLLDELNNIRRDDPNRPLLFVVHSVGGLLVKSALRYALNSGEPSEHILSSTIGIVSFGTPSIFGFDSVVAPTKEKKELLDFAKLFPKAEEAAPTAETAPSAQGNHLSNVFKQLIEMSRHSTKGRLLILHPLKDSEGWEKDVARLRKHLGGYRAMAKEIPELFFYETEELKGVGLAAPREAVVPRHRLVHKLSRISPIKRDHIDLPKVLADDHAYQEIKTAIQNFYRGKSEERSAKAAITPDPQPLIDQPARQSPLTSPKIRSRRQRYSHLNQAFSELMKQRIIELQAPSGSDLTAMAQDFVNERMEHFSSIFWVHAENKSTTDCSFRLIADRVLQSHEQVSLPTAPNDPDIFEILTWFERRANDRWLLIFNHVGKSVAASIRDYLPSTTRSQGYIVLTSHYKPEVDNQTLPGNGERFLGSSPKNESRPEIDGVPIGPIKRRDTIDLVHSPRNKKAADAAVDFSGIGAWSRIPVKEIDDIDLKLETSNDTMDWTGSLPEPDLINACVWLAPFPIPLLLAQLLWDTTPEEARIRLQKLPRDILHFNPTSSTFEIAKCFVDHRRKYLDSFINSTARCAGITSALNALVQTINTLQSLPFPETLQIKISVSRHMKNAAYQSRLLRIDKSNSVDWEVLGSFSEQQELYHEAAVFFQIALEETKSEGSSQRRISERKTPTIDSWDIPADELDTAELAVEDTRSFGASHLKLAYVRVSLKMHQYDDLPRLLAICQEVLQESESRRKRDYRKLTVEANRQIILIRLAEGKWKDAAKRERSLIDRLESDPEFGSDHPDTNAAYFHLAKIYTEHQLFEEAEAVLERPFIAFRNRDPQSSKTIEVLEDLALTYTSAGSLSKASVAYEKVLGVMEHKFGREHIQVARVKSSLASTLDAMREFERAEKLHKEAMEISKQQLGEESKIYRICKKNFDVGQDRKKQAAASASSTYK